MTATLRLNFYRADLEIYRKALPFTKFLALIIVIRKSHAESAQAESISKAMMRFQNHNRSTRLKIRDENEFILAIIIRVPNSLLLCHEICKLLIGMNTLLFDHDLMSFAIPFFNFHFLKEPESKVRYQLAPTLMHHICFIENVLLHLLKLESFKNAASDHVGKICLAIK